MKSINELLKKYNISVSELARVLNCTRANIYMKRRKGITDDEYEQLDLLLANKINDIFMIYKLLDGEAVIKEIRQPITLNKYNSIVLGCLINNRLSNTKITRQEAGDINYIAGSDSDGKQHIYHFIFQKGALL